MQRKETLLQEYKLKNKSNMFLDKRIGEKDNNLSAEDKMIARFTAERIKGAGKTSIFNLGEDFSLTHGGEKLAEIDKFDNPKSDDEDDEETLLGKDFVNEAHFGGFMTKADDDFKAGKGNNRKDYIENLIRESKKKKAEKRKAEEEAEEKTKSLDQGWKNLFNNRTRTENIGLFAKEDNDSSTNYDPYDMLVKELGFQKKQAVAGERLKTEEEKIKDEKERLQKLEADRLRRMRGEKESDVIAHASVEDMGGGVASKKFTRKERRDMEKAAKKLDKKSGDDEESESDVEEDSNGEEEEDSDAEGDSDQDGSGEDEEGDNDDNSDLIESGDEEFNAEELAGGVYNEKDAYDQETVEMMDKASKEIPYIIKVHDSYESFSALVWDRSPEELRTILERILATNHPRVSQEPELLVAHFQHVLQLTQDLCEPTYQPQLLATCLPHLGQLTQLFQQSAATCLLAACQHHHQQFSEAARPRYPGLATLTLLRTLHLLLPTSDYRHPVTTPATTFMLQVLATARPSDRSSFAACVCLCAVTLEYVSASRRLVPELITTLHGLLYVAGAGHKTRPPPPCKGGNYLTLSNKITSNEVQNLSFGEVNSVKDIDDDFKVTILVATLKIIIKLLKLYREISSSLELFEPMLSPLSNISQDKYPVEVRGMLNQVSDSIKSLKRKKKLVVKPSKKTPMLQMMEPKIEDDFDPFVKKRVGKKDVLEVQKMKHKLKQEKKGARKEIRQDTAFLANQRVKEQKLKDADRQAKTKALFSSLASQEGDYKKLLKKKKKF